MDIKQAILSADSFSNFVNKKQIITPGWTHSRSPICKILNGVMLHILKLFSRRNCLFACGVFVVSNLYAQTAGTLEINGGIRFRITPVHLLNVKYPTVLNQNPALLDEDLHLRGTSFSLGLNYFLMNDFFISYEAYVRYDLFLSTLDSTTLSYSENKKLMFDNQVALLYNVVKGESIVIATCFGFS